MTIARYHESQNHKYYQHVRNTQLAGVSIGLLSAFAISASESLSDLSRLGVEAVRVAFRLGVHVYRASQLLEPHRNDEGPPQSWAYVVTGLTEEEVQQELNQYNKQMVRGEERAASMTFG